MTVSGFYFKRSLFTATWLPVLSPKPELRENEDVVHGTLRDGKLTVYANGVVSEYPVAVTGVYAALLLAPTVLAVVNPVGLHVVNLVTGQVTVHPLREVFAVVAFRNLLFAMTREYTCAAVGAADHVNLLARITGLATAPPLVNGTLRVTGQLTPVQAETVLNTDLRTGSSRTTPRFTVNEQVLMHVNTQAYPVTGFTTRENPQNVMFATDATGAVMVDHHGHVKRVDSVDLATATAALARAMPSTKVNRSLQCVSLPTGAVALRSPLTTTRTLTPGESARPALVTPARPVAGRQVCSSTGWTVTGYSLVNLCTDVCMTLDNDLRCIDFNRVVFAAADDDHDGVHAVFTDVPVVNATLAYSDRLTAVHVNRDGQQLSRRDLRLQAPLTSVTAEHVQVLVTGDGAVSVLEQTPGLPRWRLTVFTGRGETRHTTPLCAGRPLLTRVGDQPVVCGQTLSGKAFVMTDEQLLVPMKNFTWAAGTSTYMLAGNQTAAIAVDAAGVVHPVTLPVGTEYVLTVNDDLFAVTADGLTPVTLTSGTWRVTPGKPVTLPTERPVQLMVVNNGLYALTLREPTAYVDLVCGYSPGDSTVT